MTWRRTTCPTAASSSPRRASASRRRSCSTRASRSSTPRTRTADEPAFVLHVMNADGSDIHQISFNQSHDLDPTVLDDGRVVFTRWDNARRPRRNEPLHDASGRHRTCSCSTAPTATTPAPTARDGPVPRPAPDAGRPACWSARSRSPRRARRRPARRSTSANYVENTQPTAPNAGVLPGPAQVPATANVVTDGRRVLSPGGRYQSAFPLRDGTGRMLVSWTPVPAARGQRRSCPARPSRLAATAATPAPPLYGIWIYDPRQRHPAAGGDAQSKASCITDIVALQPRALPPVLLDRVAGVDFDAGSRRPKASASSTSAASTTSTARTPRPGGIAALARPAADDGRRSARRASCASRRRSACRTATYATSDGSAFGVTSAFGMREILGYAPIEPDGSVRRQGAGQRAVRDHDARRERPAHRPAPPELAAAACGPGTAAATAATTPPSGLSHGRGDLFESAYAGAHDRPACRSRTPTRRSSRTSARRWRRSARASAARPTAPP